MDIILASASPRRLELMRLISEHFEVIPADVEEILPDEIGAMNAAEYLARLKAQSVAESHPSSLVIGCDTAVIVDDEVLGKPKDSQDAFSMLRKLSGREHSVVTGCALCMGGKTVSFSEETRVIFHELTDKEILDYIATKECDDKAGAYGIQGRGALLVKSIVGDYFNVVGMPVSRLNKEIQIFSL
ncbi:MAG: septum formation protein Maf [Clostridia bacterium]|nr:septum formation protein Maf [Clostridia bacterium]